jgi:hypothetical protein
MVLYDEDLALEGAMVDVHTTNISFIRMHALLKSMGVKNNKFFLALYDQTLVGVDPHSPDLTTEQRLRIAWEAKRNYWYFIREMVRVPAGGGPGVQYILNRANLAQAWCFLNSVDSFLTIPRQIGKTIGALCLTAWFLYFAGQHLCIGLFAKGGKLVLENVKRLKGIRDKLPKFFINHTARDSDNKEGVYYADLDNEYKTFVAQSDKQAAADQGRGESFAWEHWDELSYYDNNHLSYPSATTAASTQMDQVKASGLPCAMMITTTAGDIDSEKGMYAFMMKNQCLRFTEKLYDCKNKEELYRLLHDNSENKMLYLEYSFQQLGKDQAWFEARKVNKDAKTIAKDFLNIWQYGSQNTVLTKEILDKLVKSEREPDHIQVVKSIMIRWYVPKEVMERKDFLSRPFIIGSDSSDNIGSDYTSIVIIDPSTLAVVGVARTNQINLLQTCECLIELMRMLPNSIVIPERNKNGSVMIDTIIEILRNDQGFNPLKRFYNQIYQNYDDYANRLHQIDFSLGTYRKLLGFNTSASESSRDTLFKNVMPMSLNIGVDRVCDKDLSSEFRGLCHKNGRIDHPNGGHDDLVVAYLLACWFVLFGKSHHLYNLDAGAMLSSVDGSGSQVDPQTKQRHVGYRNRIAELENLMRGTTNPVVLRSYEREYKDLKLRYDENVAVVAPMAVSHIQASNQENLHKQQLAPSELGRIFQWYY